MRLVGRFFVLPMVRLRWLRLAATLSIGAAPSASAQDAGVYGALDFEQDELHLLETANELHGYFERQSLLVANTELARMVEEVGRVLAPRPEDDYVNFEFFVLSDPTPNAFSLPNGRIYVHTGMLARLAAPSELAAVLAHEIVHVNGHHALLVHRSTRGRRIAQIVMQGTFGAFSWESLLSGAALEASVNGFKRSLEEEADLHALSMLTDAGFDAGALSLLLSKLSVDYEGTRPRVPISWTQLPDVAERAATTSIVFDFSPKTDFFSSDFERLVLPVRLATIEDYIQDDYPHTALALVQELIEHDSQASVLRFMEGEAWQAMRAQSFADPEQWSNRDRRRNMRRRLTRQEDERFQRQLRTPEGQLAYEENLTNAEMAYRAALELDSLLTQSHRGLGEVYEQQRQYRDAAEQYVIYLREDPSAVDREVILQRLRLLAELIRAE